MNIGKITIDPQVMARVLGEEVVILDLASGTYFGLDPVGARIWQLIAQGHSLAEVRDRLLAEYDVSPQEAERDLQELVDQLVARRLITIG